MTEGRSAPNRINRRSAVQSGTYLTDQLTSFPVYIPQTEMKCEHANMRIQRTRESIKVGLARGSMTENMTENMTSVSRFYSCSSACDCTVLVVRVFGKTHNAFRAAADRSASWERQRLGKARFEGKRGRLDGFRRSVTGCMFVLRSPVRRFRLGGTKSTQGSRGKGRARLGHR